MDRILVAVFPCERQAYDGLRCLAALDQAGTITVYATAVIARDDESLMSVKKPADQGPLGGAVALLTGTLLGPLAGPAGLAVSASVGTLGRVLYDLARVGVDDDFLTEVGERLQPGTAALLAEVWEERIAEVDSRFAALGGSAVRRARGEIIEGRVGRDVVALRDELESLRQELAHAAEAHRPGLEEKIGATTVKLRASRERVQGVLNAALKESEAKVSALGTRVAKEHGAAKATLEARIAETRSQTERRCSKLREAWEMATQALA